MNYRDGIFMLLGWQTAIACRFSLDLAFGWWDQRKRPRVRAVQPTDTP